MALGDPFGASAEIAYNRRMAMNNIAKLALEKRMKDEQFNKELGAKKDLMAEEYRLKSKYPDPMTAIIMKSMGLTGGNNESTDNSNLSIPATTPEEAINRLPKGEFPEDYKIKSESRSLKGIPMQIYTPEKKPLVQPSQQKELNQIKQARILLERNMETLNKNPQIKKFIGPGLVQRPGAMADIIGQLGGSPKDFVTFKADVDKAFQKYRKEITGVQAGYPELQWLAPDLPKTTDTAENFISKTVSAIEQFKMAENQLLDVWGKAGMAVGKLKETSKVKMTSPDGKIWELDQSEAEEAKKHGWK
jgi:hypothetical protein